MNTYYIKLGNITYQCRNNRGIREVLHDGQYRSCEDFIGMLMKSGSIGSIYAIMLYVRTKQMEVLSQ